VTRRRPVRAQQRSDVLFPRPSFEGIHLR
jgi:hypothetical protein